MVPVLCGSALTGMGTMALINAIIDLLPLIPPRPPLRSSPMPRVSPVEFATAPGAMPAALGVQDHRRPVRQVFLCEGASPAR